VRSLSHLAVLRRVWVRVQRHAAGHDFAGKIGQPTLMSICAGEQPNKGLREADAELLGERPGDMVDLAWSRVRPGADPPSGS